MIIDVRTRDLGNGSEVFPALEGEFVSGYDAWGKREFRSPGRASLYLFDDEWIEIARPKVDWERTAKSLEEAYQLLRTERDALRARLDTIHSLSHP